jgi:hypothetical protein
MEHILHNMMEVECFLEDIGIFSNDFEIHMHMVCKVLTHLQDNGFTINPLNGKWAVQETDWLDYLVMPTVSNHGI